MVTAPGMRATRTQSVLQVSPQPQPWLADCSLLSEDAGSHSGFFKDCMGHTLGHTFAGCSGFLGVVRGCSRMPPVPRA